MLYGAAAFGLAMSVFSLAKRAMSNFSSERGIIPASDNIFQRIQDDIHLHINNSNAANTSGGRQSPGNLIGVSIGPNVIEMSITNRASAEALQLQSSRSGSVR